MRFLRTFGRVLMSALFIGAAFNQVTHFEANVSLVRGHGLPFPGLLLSCAMTIQVIGGLLFLFGPTSRWGAGILLCFVIPATAIFHTNFSDPVEIDLFAKDIAIAGSLLIMITGPTPHERPVEQGNGMM